MFSHIRPLTSDLCPLLRRESKMQDVAVGDLVVLALEPHLAGVARAGLTTERRIVVIGDGLHTNETALEIGMNHRRRLRSLGASRDGPRRRLLRAGGEERDQIEQLMAGADQPVEAGLAEPDRSEIFLALL